MIESPKFVTEANAGGTGAVGTGVEVVAGGGVVVVAPLDEPGLVAAEPAAITGVIEAIFTAQPASDPDAATTINERKKTRNTFG